MERSEGVAMEYKLLTNEIEELIELYTQNTWPFHGSAPGSKQGMVASVII